MYISVVTLSAESAVKSCETVGYHNFDVAGLLGRIPGIVGSAGDADEGIRIEGDAANSYTSSIIECEVGSTLQAISICIQIQTLVDVSLAGSVD